MNRRISDGTAIPASEQTESDDEADASRDEREEGQCCVSVVSVVISGRLSSQVTEPESIRKTAALMPPKKPIAGPGTRTPSRSCLA